MDILIESTKNFEKDLDGLSSDEKAIAVEKINQCTEQFSTHKADVYHALHRHALAPELNGYESSLYILEVSPELSAILSVDEDPIFGQVIFTLFRVVQRGDLDKAYQDVAESLYRDIFQRDRQIAQIS